MYCEENSFPDEQLPPSPALKVIRVNDPDYGLTEDEIQDRYEFIRCYLMSEFKTLMMIPKQEKTNDFFIPDVDVHHEEYNAFNTHDYQKTQQPFNKYGYAMNKVLERVKDLAILHSCITDNQRRESVHRRYEALLDCEFRYHVLALAERHAAETNNARRLHTKQKVAELNRRIMTCNSLWAHHASAET